MFEVAFMLPDSETYHLTTSGSFSQIFLQRVGSGNIPGFPQSSTGTLTPGSYLLHADLQGSFGLLNQEMVKNFLDSSLSFQLQAVPEPSSLIFLGVGLA